MKALINTIVVLLTAIDTTMLYAQQTIVLKDNYTGLPVTNAWFHIGDQKGRSDRDGRIVFAGDDKSRLVITHINYESVTLKPAEIPTALRRGWIALMPSADGYLHPVTVYAVKGKAVHEKIPLGNGDWVQHDAGQVIQQIPGFGAVKKSGVFGADPVFRGFKQAQLNLVTDGALVSATACPNRMDPPASQVSVSQVQQIEIIKGPYNFRYGPVMGAVINFISPDPVFTASPTAFGRITTGYESNGRVYRAEGSGGIRTKKTQLALTGSWSNGSDYKDGNDSLIPAGFNRGTIGLTIDRQVRPGHLLKIAATRNFARNTDFPTLMMDLFHDDTWMLQGQYKIKARHAWYSQWTTQLYASFVDHAMGNRFRPAAASVQAFTGATTATNGGRTEFAINKKRSVMYIGADWKYESIEGNRTRKMITGTMAGKTFVDTLWQNSNMTRGGVFGEWHYQLSQYKVTVSGRADVVHANAKQPAKNFEKRYAGMDQTDLNTSISAGIGRQWNNIWQAGIWLGRGTRSASITEKYINSLPIGMDPYELLGNPALKPEANHQADLVFGYKLKGTTVQWNGFASLVTDYISSVIDPEAAPLYGAPGVRQYVNIDKAILFGFEWNWQQQWMPGLDQQVTVAYAYGRNQATGKPLPEIAPVDIRYKLRAAMCKNRIQPFTQLRTVGRQNRVANDFGEKPASPFTTLDIGVQTVFIKKIPLTFSVYNLFDKAYREHLSRFIRPTLPLNAPGRSFVLMASYEL